MQRQHYDSVIGRVVERLERTCTQSLRFLIMKLQGWSCALERFRFPSAQTSCSLPPTSTISRPGQPSRIPARSCVGPSAVARLGVDPPNCCSGTCCHCFRSRGCPIKHAGTRARLKLGVCSADPGLWNLALKPPGTCISLSSPPWIRTCHGMIISQEFILAAAEIGIFTPPSWVPHLCRL